MIIVAACIERKEKIWVSSIRHVSHDPIKIDKALALPPTPIHRARCFEPHNTDKRYLHHSYAYLHFWRHFHSRRSCGPIKRFGYQILFIDTDARRMMEKK